MDVPIAPDRRRAAAAGSIMQLRSRLLDLTARNPLISFPHGKATGTRTHVRAVDGYVDVLFAHLGDAKPLTIRSLPPPDGQPEDEQEPVFRAGLEAARLTDERYLEETAGLSADELGSAKAAMIDRKLKDRVRASAGLPQRTGGTPTALADYAARLGIDASFDLRPSPQAAAKTQGRSAVEFQALALPDALERQLAKIRDTARTVAEETGVSTLHLAFGFLDWFESDASDRPLTSPLLLLRVDIARRIVRSRYQYSVSAVGDEAEVNLTLSERLSGDFRIKLPLLGEEETPEAYFARVRDEVCKGRSRWAVRRFVTLAHFPFARLAMFQDLDEDQWPGGLSSHPVVASLLGGHEAGESTFATEHDVDAAAVSAKVPVLVLDADASQHSAIYDVMCGKNLVIEGPPGTGKSQTITNVIAAALSHGKRVLFVADKQAALQVVKDRLDKVGLGDFCLELHSGKARKTDVLTSLARRLDRRSESVRADRLDDKLRELAATRAALTRYVALLNTRFGALGHTVHDILWADRRRRDGEGAEARHLDGVALPGAETLSEWEIDTRRAALDRFERAAAPVLAGFGEVTAHPWWGVTRSGLPSVDMEQAVRDTEDTAASMAGLAQAAEVLHPFGLPPETTLDDLGPVLEALATLKVDADTPTDWFAAFADADMREAAAAWQQACGRYRASVEEQAKLLDLPAGTEPAEAAERLRAAWSPVAPTVPTGLAVSELLPWAADLHAKAAALVEMDQVALQTVAAVGLTTTENLGEVAVAAAALTLAAEPTQTVADFATPELMRNGSADIVATVAASIRAARARRAELDAEYSIPPSMEPGSLRQHAATLAAAGLFGFMSPAVKTAKVCFAGLQRTPRKASKRAMAAALVSIAEHLGAVAAIEADLGARSAFGPAYRGLATEVDTALAVVGWAARVRSTLPQSESIGALLCAVLLAGDPDRLLSLRALAARPDHGRLLADLARFPPTAASFADLAARLREQAKCVETLAATCRDYGVPAITRASDLPGICDAMVTTAKAWIAAQVPAALDSALQGTCPAPLDEHAALDAALRLAIALDRLSLPQSMRKAL